MFTIFTIRYDTCDAPKILQNFGAFNRKNILCDKPRFSSYYSYTEKLRGDILKEYERCLDLIRKYLKDETLKFDEKKLDFLISEELEKASTEMDTQLIDLCLNALVAYRIYLSGEQI